MEVMLLGLTEKILSKLVVNGENLASTDESTAKLILN
jgi:hypothetical protein